MMRRTIPDASSLEEANEIVRGNWLNAIEQHHQQYSGNLKIRDILDIGCSVGVSTRFLADKFPSAKLTELSPVLFTLMKSTEPFLDEYYLLDLEKVVKDAGFVNVQIILTDPRHRTLTATVPY
ncbi:hypothetical protein SSX86_016675 [Deinandra increscens subsp. villosa]|uniref:Methyltransferase type 11 domain-containing protein n=1 Tax=Deinandra increscens subsp. villosa TaxID=3103831 RepID=A0AAP0GYM2_9ASTR